MSNFTYAFNKLKNKHILLVTGDVKYHSWQNLNYYKLACLDVGHGIENCFVDYIANLLKTSFINLNIYAIKTQIYEHVII
jgi:putative NIF3 family GTP cyclohydrolase 1 type 2